MSAQICVDANENVEKSDSLSHAYGVVIANFISENIPTDSIDRECFIKGLLDATTSQETNAYYYGVLNGKAVISRVQSMSQLNVPINAENVLKVLSAIIRSPQTEKMDAEEANRILNEYIASQYEATPDTFSIESQKIFVDSMAQANGAIKLQSGVIIIPMNLKDGSVGRVGDKVLVSYEGRLSDGTVFDSTDEPIEMIIGGLIPGFNEALLRTPEGSTMRYIIPWNQAYGKDGIAGVIPGYATLDFTITLEKILH